MRKIGENAMHFPSRTLRAERYAPCIMTVAFHFRSPSGYRSSPVKEINGSFKSRAIRYWMGMDFMAGDA